MHYVIIKINITYGQNWLGLSSFDVYIYNGVTRYLLDTVTD